MIDCDTALAALLFGHATAGSDAHRAGCARCADDAPAVQAVRAAFDAAPAPVPSDALTAHVLGLATPLLATNAHRLPAVAWPRMAAAIAVALLPLPVILLAGWRALELADRLLSAVLPPRLSFYLVATHAAVLALVLAITYGAVPLLAAHQLRLRHEEPHG
jgi:hypothetical protein